MNSIFLDDIKTIMPKIYDNYNRINDLQCVCSYMLNECKMEEYELLKKVIHELKSENGDMLHKYMKEKQLMVEEHENNQL